MPDDVPDTLPGAATPSPAPDDPTPAADDAPPTRLVHLRAAGVSIVLDAGGPGLPGVLYWGADLGDLDGPELHALATVSGMPTRSGGFDTAVPLAILPEAAGGWFGIPGVSGHRGGQDWSVRFVLDEVEVAPGDDGEDGATLRAEASDPDAGLAVELEVEILPSGLIRTRAELTNTGADVFDLGGIRAGLPVPSHATEIGDFTGRWAKERSAQRHAFTHGSHVRTSRRGRPGFDSQVVYAVGTAGFGFRSGEVWAVHLAWSGNQQVYAERMPTGAGVLGGGEDLLAGEVRLAPGESYPTPWLYAAHGAGLDRVSERFHDHLRARPHHPPSPRPVVCNTWEAVYFDHDLDRLKALADAAASVGAERYVLDDGWFGSRRNDRSGLGDWFVAPDVWPDGLHPIVDHVRGLGLQFGLWFEPEMVNPDSDLARAHPDWILSLPHRMPPPARHQQVLDLGRSDVYDYLLERLDSILTEYDIAYVKWDHNRELVDPGHHPEGTPGVHAQTLALYRLLDELRARHPGLEIESCSSGGGRVDLGILERTDRVWGSDCIDPLERLGINRGTTSLIPLELLGSHIGSPTSHTTGRTHDLAFRAGTAIFGHLGIEWDLTSIDEVEQRRVAGWVALYKQWREVLHAGRLVRADHHDPSTWITGVVARDRSRALFGVSTVAAPVTMAPGAIRLPGLDTDGLYRVRGLRPEGDEPTDGPRPRGFGQLPDVVLPGAVLEHAGIQFPPQRPEQIVLVQVERVDERPS